MSSFWIVPWKYLSLSQLPIKKTKTRELKFPCKLPRSALNLGKTNLSTLLMVYSAVCKSSTSSLQKPPAYLLIKTSICNPLMFLYGLLPSCSGQKLSRYLQVPGNAHCTCLEQLCFSQCLLCSGSSAAPICECTTRLTAEIVLSDLLLPATLFRQKLPGLHHSVWDHHTHSHLIKKSLKKKRCQEGGR